MYKDWWTYDCLLWCNVLHSLQRWAKSRTENGFLDTRKYCCCCYDSYSLSAYVINECEWIITDLSMINLNK